MPLAEKGFRDRTSQFQHFVDLQCGIDERGTKGKEPASLFPRRVLTSDFLKAAQRVSREISHVVLKLKKLSLLAKKKSLFEDPTVDFNEMTFGIKKDIRNLQLALEDLEKTYGNRKGSHNANILGCLDADLRKVVKAFSNILEERSESIQAQQKTRFFGNLYTDFISC
jgi:hypothetical protein